MRFFMDVTLLPAPRGRKGFDPQTVQITPKHPAASRLHAVHGTCAAQEPRTAAAGNRGPGSWRLQLEPHDPAQFVTGMTPLGGEGIHDPQAPPAGQRIRRAVLASETWFGCATLVTDLHTHQASGHRDRHLELPAITR